MPWVISKRGTRYWKNAPQYYPKKRTGGPVKRYVPKKSGYKRPRSSNDVTLSGYGNYRRGSKRVSGRSRVPTIRNTKGDGVIVRHKEFIQDILSSVVFQNQYIGTQSTSQSAIQPGNPSLFPWLSQIAKNFEEWEPRGMKT